MWQRLRQKHGLTVKRDLVMKLDQMLDPQGSADRKKKLQRRVYRSKQQWKEESHLVSADTQGPHQFSALLLCL
jgi:hypothetical protein